nr:MAG TPA: hypothetical protein [Caudoviricetes sp.]
MTWGKPLPHAYAREYTSNADSPSRDYYLHHYT